MAGYGLTVINDAGAISIDSEYARLCVLQSGRYSGASGAAVVSFSPAISTQEPPMVFVRPDSNGGIVTIGCSISGSPGNWTGMIITGPVNYNPAGKYFVSGFAASATALYGMRLWDGNGKLLFDSGTQHRAGLCRTGQVSGSEYRARALVAERLSTPAKCGVFYLEKSMTVIPKAPTW